MKPSLRGLAPLALFLGLSACGLLLPDSPTAIEGERSCSSLDAEGACGEGTLCCGGRCVRADEKNCYACGVACTGATSVCAADQRACTCGPMSCAAVTERCDATQRACVACEGPAHEALPAFLAHAGESDVEALTRAQATVGVLRWGEQLVGAYTDPGNMAGRRVCNGTLVGGRLLLTAAHCFEETGDPTWRFPRKASRVPLSVAEIASQMKVTFALEGDGTADGAGRSQVSIALNRILEFRIGNIDYALALLAEPAPQALGYARIARRELARGTAVALFAHDDEGAKQGIHTEISAVNGAEATYGNVRAQGPIGGAPVFDPASGRLCGLHRAATCAPEGSSAIATTVDALVRASPRLRELATVGNKDLDGSGTADILLYEPAAGHLFTWSLGGPEAIAVVDQKTLPLVLPPGAASVVRGDVDGDGWMDLASYDQARRVVTVHYLGGADGLTIARKRTLAVPGAATDVMELRAAADVDRDGRADLVWQRTTAGRSVALAWVLGGTDTPVLARESELWSLPLPYRIGAAGDLNRDGAIDVVWHDEISGSVMAWFGSPDDYALMDHWGYLTWNVKRSTTEVWRIDGLCDLDRDGNVDLFWVDLISGEMGPWLLEGSAGIKVRGNRFIDRKIADTARYQLVF